MRERRLGCRGRRPAAAGRFAADPAVVETGWAHSNEEDKLLWVPVDQAAFAAADKSASRSPDDLLPLVPMLDPILKAELFLIAKAKLFIGEKKFRSFLEILENNRKIFIHPIPRTDADGNKVKSGVGYARTPYTN